MGDPHPLTKYLGLAHRMQVTGSKGDTTTLVDFDMGPLFKRKAEAYVQVTHLALRKA